MLNKQKILVVDDDPIVVEFLHDIVTSFSYSVTIAKDGLQAVDQLRKENFPLVITDISMPNMGGMELLKYITEFYPDTDVIVATGNNEKTTLVDVIKAGASDYLIKPISTVELEAKLQRIFREKALLNELHKKEAQYRTLIDHSPN